MVVISFQYSPFLVGLVNIVIQVSVSPSISNFTVMPAFNVFPSDGLEISSNRSTMDTVPASEFYAADTGPSIGCCLAFPIAMFASLAKWSGAYVFSQPLV
jgi:hypothetical protein